MEIVTTNPHGGAGHAATPEASLQNPWSPRALAGSLLENWLGVPRRSVAGSEYSIVALVIRSKLERNANVGF